MHNKIKLYHGSNCNFLSVDLSKSKDRRDFGKGFYLTTLQKQAEEWADVLFARYGGDGIFVYEFVSIHTEKALASLNLINKTYYDY
jgi:hypothetical protein